MRKTVIIAEAGVNHNGSIALAKKMIRKAAEAGVDYVKFQTFNVDDLVVKNAIKANYQTNPKLDETQYEMLKKLQLSKSQHYELIDYCNIKNIKFLSTAFDLESVSLLGELNLGLWKIPSGEITNYPYLRAIAQYKQPTILSTGMSTISDIQSAVYILEKNGLIRDKLTILHCNTEYPTPYSDVNLNSMITISKEFGVRVGYSDHTLGIEVPIAAVALGATIVEKHFTLDRTLEGPDHKASLEPNELKTMVSSIRNIEQALGDSRKEVSESELKNVNIARKSIVALKTISKGEVFTEENICIKRPGTGISPMLWEQILGKSASKDYYPDELIQL